MSLDTWWIEADRISDIQLSDLRKLMASAPLNSINLALGELGYEMPEEIKEYAISILAHSTPRYTENAGLPELRQAICHQYYPDISTSQICVCNGAEEALYICMQASVNPGDVVAIPDPDYPAYPVLAKMAGAQVVRLPFGEDLHEIDWAQWEAILASGVKILLFSHPSNPSGFVFSQADFAHFVHLVNKYNILVMVDEIYSQLYYEPLPHLDWTKIHRCLRIDGVSKSHLLSGWRVGWIAGQASSIASMIKTKQYISTCTPWLSQKVAEFAISKPHIVSGVRAMLFESRQLCLAEFSQCTQPLCIHSPVATPYLLLKMPAIKVQDLIHHGVITVPGTAFGTVTRDWLRVNFAIPSDILLIGLRRLISA